MKRFELYLEDLNALLKRLPETEVDAMQWLLAVIEDAINCGRDLEDEMIRINDARVAVDDTLHYRPMDTCPVECKVLLLTKDGVAVLGKLKAIEARDLWAGWFPLPKRL